ncbi:DMT family transporter [Pseudooceanicola aestuarii]|uniref:DMT family transporter n=1 Tax=Pseudooceanicola aestuarii TaxID=2697319 RepID=UPI0013D72BB7|nr:DMT family transporter [Pseudooceanicola aestuarii]
MTTSSTSRPTVGILWMLLAGALFVGVNALVKLLGEGMPATQAAFLRYALGLVFLLPVLPRLVRSRITPRHWRLFLLRGGFHGAGVALWFYAMTRIPLADVTAMNYMSPIYVTLGAALFMGEKLALRRILAIVVALIGALIILRPGMREITSGHYAMLGTAVIFAGSYMVAKQLADEVGALLIVAMLSVVVTLMLLPLAIPVWVRPEWWQIGVLFGVAALATTGHYVMTLAFAAAPMTVTQPVTFLQLVWAVALGALAFGEAIDPFVMLGGGLIIASVCFITWREAMVKRRSITPAPNATRV